MSKSDDGPGGTLLLTNERTRPVQFHHSVEFDGYKHTTACGREIDTDYVADVFLEPVEAWNKRVAPSNSCPMCYDSVYQRREFEQTATEEESAHE